MTALTHARKLGLAALGFALTLLTAPSFGHSPDIPAQVGPANGVFIGPPHNAIYWWNHYNNPQTILQSLTSACDPKNGPGPGSGCYTDVILSSIFPNPNCTANSGYGPLLEAGNFSGVISDLGGYVQQLHAAGKTVLISFGGSGPNLTANSYANCYYNNMEGLVQAIVAFANQYSFDGVDIDFEDTTAFGYGPGNPSSNNNLQQYDGVDFLEKLTSGLGQQLSFPQNIITHAPQTPYLTSVYTANNGFSGYGNPPYAQIYYDVGQYIGWFNNQFYNQDCETNDTANSTPQTSCASTFLNDYQTIVSNTGLPPLLLVLGLSACPSCGSGWLNYGDVTWLISQLQAQYRVQFGGVMAWAADDAPGNWNSEVWNALKTNQAKWYAYDDATQQCLDDNNGTVVVDQCAAKPSQYWQFSANAIINASTGNCLDAGNGDHTQSCIPGDLYQLWQFFGNSNGGATIVSRHSLYGQLYSQGTSYCLDASQTPPDFPCNGNTYQSWMGGAQ
jgi:chitinase